MSDDKDDFNHVASLTEAEMEKRITQHLAAKFRSPKIPTAQNPGPSLPDIKEHIATTLREGLAIPFPRSRYLFSIYLDPEMVPNTQPKPFDTAMLVCPHCLGDLCGSPVVDIKEPVPPIDPDQTLTHSGRQPLFQAQDDTGYLHYGDHAIECNHCHTLTRTTALISHCPACFQTDKSHAYRQPAVTINARFECFSQCGWEGWSHPRIEAILKHLNEVPP